jgi:hypothetical protein
VSAIRFSIVSDGAAGRFGINPLTGQIYTNDVSATIPKAFDLSAGISSFVLVVNVSSAPETLSSIL